MATSASLPSVRISLNSSPEEGGNVFESTITVVDSTLLSQGTVYWKLSGIDDQDLIQFYADTRGLKGLDGLSGTGVLNNGSLLLKHLLVRDSDFGETLTLSAYADAGMTQLLGSESVSIQETPANSTPKLRGKSLYAIVDKDTWTSAEAAAQDLGGHLMTINDRDEYDWGRANLWQDFSRPLTHYFVGLNDVVAEGTYVWASGEQSDWTNITDLIFRQGFLAQQGNASANDYFVISSNDVGFTGDFEQVFRGDLYNGRFGNLIWADDNSTFYKRSANEHYGIAEVPISASVALSNTPKEGTGGFTTTLSLGAAKESAQALLEGLAVYWRVEGITDDDLASGSLQGNGTVQSGILEVDHSLAADSDTGEEFKISFYSDADMKYQIGATFTTQIEEASPDVITGILDLPGRVNLRSKGVTPFTIYGNDGLDVTAIDLKSLRFGLTADSVVGVASKRNGTLFASYEDANNDGIVDLAIKVNTPSLASLNLRGSREISGYGQLNSGANVLLGLAAGDGVVFA